MMIYAMVQGPVLIPANGEAASKATDQSVSAMPAPLIDPASGLKKRSKRRQMTFQISAGAGLPTGCITGKSYPYTTAIAASANG